MANSLFDTGYCFYAQPCFFVNLEFSDSWGWENNGENGGVANIDIDAEAAWEKTTGSPDVQVAVLDMGCELTHSVLSTSLVAGNDATDGGDSEQNGNCNNQDPHGTAPATARVLSCGM